MAGFPEERDFVEPSAEEATPAARQSAEEVEEAKLRAKYPNIVPHQPGGSHFLRKRLQKGQKYFDSGDYNMAKAKMKNKQLPQPGGEVTGDHIPTPQDLPQRKSGAMASKLAG